MPAQQHCDSYSLLPAFYNGLKSKVGLAAAKTAVMRINLNIDGGDHFDLRQPCLLMIEVGRRVVDQSYHGDRGAALTLVRLE